MSNDDNIPDDTIMFNMKKKKKSSKRTNRNAPTEATPIASSTDNITADGTTNNGDDDFTYEYLITRVFDVIRQTNPGISEDHHIRIILPPPQLARIGTKRTSFVNFGSVCKLLKRQEKHLYHYFVVELGTTASIDSNHALIMRARLGQRQIETILRSYIKEYVNCKTCHSPDTLLKKEERLPVIICNTCHSQYTVSSIKTGFQAQIGRRSNQTS